MLGTAPPECSLSQGESPPSSPSTTTSPGPKRTCPSRKESACRSSTTRECPCPCSQAHVLSCHLCPSCGTPAQPSRTSCPRDGCSERCAEMHTDTVTCPRTLTLKGVICLLPHPPGPAAGHCGLTALSPATSSLCWPFCTLQHRATSHQSCPHPCSAPSCQPGHIPQLHGCFSLGLYTVSGLSFSLDSSFSLSMLSFRRKVDVRCVLHILTVIINDLNDQSLSAAHLRAGWVEQGWEEMVSRWFCGWLHLSSLSDQNRARSPFPCWGNVPSRAVCAPGSSEPIPFPCPCVAPL